MRTELACGCIPHEKHSRNVTSFLVFLGPFEARTHAWGPAEEQTESEGRHSSRDDMACDKSLNECRPKSRSKALT